MAAMAPLTIPTGDAALFFFAGHGCEYENDNWLISKEGWPSDDRDIPRWTLNVRSELLGQMQKAGARLTVLLLDCCRVFEGMHRSTRAGGRGLAKMEAPKGSVIAFACAPNAEAEDGGTGRNGVFTTHLLKHIQTPGKDVGLMLRGVVNAVDEATGGKQVPHVEHSLRDENVCLC
eukprot:Transcript_10727.p2 GENE.Transcript_10727~~Transcript_10727.p2  ORF type:complete len:175 (+),score=59.03 Transcript_10727:283-807(+)